MTAAARARETARPDRLFEDPWAAALAGEEGVALLKRLEAAARPADATGPSDNPYIAIRTRAFDDILLADAAEGGLRQLVVVAAGLDTRAYRLDWPAGTRLYELDRPDVLAAKQRVMDAAGAVPRCARHAVGVDLGAPWTDALAASGFDRAVPSAWLVEGLFPYLDDATARAVVAQTAAMAAPGSRLAADIIGRGFLESPWTRDYLKALEREGAPWRSGTDDPEGFFATVGWEATVRQPGEDGANFGRWPFPVFPRNTPGVPQSYLVTAVRKAQQR